MTVRANPLTPKKRVTVQCEWRVRHVGNEWVFVDVHPAPHS
jgi:hypothetical protein